MGGIRMRLIGLFLFLCTIAVAPAHAESLFFEDEPVQQGLRVADVSATFAVFIKSLTG